MASVFIKTYFKTGNEVTDSGETWGGGHNQTGAIGNPRREASEGLRRHQTC